MQLWNILNRGIIFRPKKTFTIALHLPNTSHEIQINPASLALYPHLTSQNATFLRKLQNSHQKPTNPHKHTHLIKLSNSRL